ncbi:trypsin-like isoform X1 [Maniola jurtina]|uniref:trypsin-like isoform X1 n=1 Tax=Maniola jurtina TaxID=191418 RepID=UPI001E685CC4|nr:trypsin-like isoform X1 [Maniola jurtina]XP_045760364.1 trypsin-like isoform X1 [Maniola jurtina]
MFTFELLLLCIPSPGVPYTYLPEHETVVNSWSYNTNIVTDIKQLPYHVLIVYGSKYCSGTLTGSRTVVTAATCFVRNKGEPIVVKAGSNSMVGSGQIISVLEYKVHEYFQNLSNLDNDIALLILKEHVLFDGNVIKAQLVESEVALRESTPIKVSGWGGPHLPVKYLNLLLQSEMIVINKAECEISHKSLLTPSNFCVKYRSEGRLSDNGGGATFKNILVGILSWGANSKDQYNVAILTNVSYFERWIKLNTIRFLTKYCVVKENSKLLGIHSDEYVES